MGICLVQRFVHEPRRSWAFDHVDTVSMCRDEARGQPSCRWFLVVDDLLDGL